MRNTSHNLINNTSGISLIELMITIGVFVTIATLGSMQFKDHLQRMQTQTAAHNTATVLTNARNQATTALYGSDATVCVSTHTIQITRTNKCADGSTVYTTNNNITLTVDTAHGAGKAVHAITFQKLTGASSNHTITVAHKSGAYKKTINISPAGLITLQ